MDAVGAPAAESARLVREFANTSLARCTDLSDRLVDALWDDVYRPAGPVGKEDLWRSCYDNMGSILGVLSGTGMTEQGLYRTAHATGSRRAQQHCPLDWVLHAWRLGGQVLWSDLAAQTGAQRPHELTLLVNGAGSVWTVIEQFSSEMAATYHRAERDLRAGADFRLREVLAALLAGEASTVAPGTEDSLGFTRDGSYLAVVVTGPATEAQLRADLAARGLWSAWVTRADHLAGVLAVHGEPAELVRTLRAVVRGRIGVSPACAGLGEIAAGYRMAALAQATLPAGANEVVTLDDQLPTALLISSPDLTERVLGSTLGPILELPDGECDELLNTLAAWLMSMGSAVRAARVLYCHRNTVLNRLHRIEALTNVNPMAPQEWVRFLLALIALRHSGRHTTPLIHALDLP